MPLLNILIFIAILICLQTLFQYYDQKELIDVPFHKTIVILHVYFICHLVYVLISKMFFATGGWVENSAPFGLMYGPFIFCLTYTYPRNQWPSVKALWHLLPWCVFSVIHVVFLFTGVDMYSKTAWIYMNILYFLIPASFLIYSIWGWWNVKSPGSRMGFTFYLFLFVAVMGMIVVGIGMMEGVIQGADPVMGDMEHELNGYKVYTFFLVLMIILNRYATRLLHYPVQKISGNLETPIPSSNPEISIAQQNLDIRYEKSGLNGSALDRYEHALDSYVEEHSPWLDPHISLQVLATQLKLPPHHLTQLINIRKKKSFNQYINEKRVEFACELLSNNKRELTFEKIGYECGFNSKATFYRWFKNVKAMSPSEFMDTLE